MKMNSKKIPRPKLTTETHGKIKRQAFNVSSSGIAFSFEAMEETDYFNLDVTCENWSKELFDMLKNVSSIRKEELLSGSYAKSTYRVHSHENAKPPSELPDGVELKDCYQIRISKSKGGIHGVFQNDIFYVIWFDPLHNMYPDDRYGGLRKVKSPGNCCKDRDEEIKKLMDENLQLKRDNQFWEQEVEKMYSK